MTSNQYLEPDAARDLLGLRDLTGPCAGHHALQVLLDAIRGALAQRLGVAVHLHRPNPVVPVVDNDDRLGHPPDAVARDARYSRYLSDRLMLRSHTSAAMPDLHTRVARGEMHRDGGRARPHVAHRTPRVHPDTRRGREVDVRGDDGSWSEVAECGLTHPRVLAQAGLPPSASGLAMGLGLERLLMLRKGIDDIRVLRADDPRIADQLVDLAPYRPVSTMPPVRRDLSLAVAADVDAEVLGDRVAAPCGRRPAPWSASRCSRGRRSASCRRRRSPGSARSQGRTTCSSGSSSATSSAR
jgi:phenylalanyl-tRNA synthetase alpha chain